MLSAIGTLAMLGGSILNATKGENRDIVDKWNNLMYQTGKKNKSGQCFELLKIIPKFYGFDAIVSLPIGFDFDELENMKSLIQNAFSLSNIHLEWKKVDSCAYIRFIEIPFNKDAEFEPVKVKPYEAWIGQTDYYKDIIADMRTHPHILVSGATGTGKSVFIFMLLLNSIINSKPSETNIYLAQVSDKHDLRVFRDVEHVKYYAQSLEEAVIMYAHLYDEMVKRNRIIDKYTNINNIVEFNQKFKKDAFPIIQIFTDEYSYYMKDEETDSPKTMFLKDQCIRYLKDIAKQGRSTGMYLICGLQRPDKESMPAIFKGQLNIRIAMRQNNTASSLVVIDDGEAVKLEEREALVLFGARRNKITTPYCDMDLIERYATHYYTIDEHILDLKKYNHLLAQAERAGKKEKKNKNNKEDVKPVEKENNVTDIGEVKGNKKQRSSKGKKGVINE